MAQRDYPEGEIKGRLLDIRRAVDAALQMHDVNLREPFVKYLDELKVSVDSLLAKIPPTWRD